MQLLLLKYNNCKILLLLPIVWADFLAELKDLFNCISIINSKIVIETIL